jgi:hypothetical protein
MNISIVLGSDSEFYYCVDGKIVNKLSVEDLKLLNYKPSSGAIRLSNYPKMEIE